MIERNPEHFDSVICSNNNEIYMYRKTPPSEKSLWGIARGQTRRQDGGIMFLSIDDGLIPLSLNLVHAYDGSDPYEKDAIRRAIVQEMKKSEYIIVKKKLDLPTSMIQFVQDDLAGLESL